MQTGKLYSLEHQRHDIFSLRQTAIVSFPDKVFHFGGYDQIKRTQIDIVASFENGSWKKIRNLLQPRAYGHNAIRIENDVFIIGGQDYNL